ncbi:MAG: lactonase family protein, partial [Verrucomicrobiales bacterium]
MNHCLCFIGTYTRPLNHVHGRATGIHSVRLCLETGALTGLTVSEPVDNTSYLCSDSTGDRLHAISEITGWHGTPDGCITTFAIAGNSLRKLSQSSSRGRGPAYIRLDHSGRWLLCANYLEGNAAIFPVRDNGTLAQPTQTIPFTGGGPDPSRQQSPHPHAIVPTPDNRFVHIIDLGTDLITGHRFDHRTGTLTRDPALDHHCGPGKGPRHFLHHPTTRTAYCVLELSSEVQTCRQLPVTRPRLPALPQLK